MSEKYVRQNERGQWIVDLLWPDGVRNRPTMPTEHKANEISIRFQTAKVDGTWSELRKKLDPEEAVQLMLFKDFGQLYLEEYVNSYNRDCDDKAGRIRILGQILNKIPMDSLQQQHATKFVNWRKKRKVKNITINHDLIVLGQCSHGESSSNTWSATRYRRSRS